MTTLTDTCEICDEKAVGSVVHPGGVKDHDSVIHKEQYKTRLYFCAEHETEVCDHTDLYCAFRDPFLEIRHWLTGFLNKFNKPERKTMPKIDHSNLKPMSLNKDVFAKVRRDAKEIIENDIPKYKLCAHCQYFRQPMKIGMFTDGDWCSNSKSKNAREYITGFDACDQFTDGKKKAPLWMRIAKKVMKWLN